MPSVSYRRWRTVRAATLNDIEAMYSAVGGTGRAKLLAAQQLIRAYVVLLSAEFQGFCKELHRECVEHVVGLIPVPVRDMTRKQFLWNRAIDRGNPTPSNLGADFGRLGLKFWDELERIETDVPNWRRILEKLNEWRNAVAHNDYDPEKLGATLLLRPRDVREWRSCCGRLVRVFDTVLGRYLAQATGTTPW